MFDISFNPPLGDTISITNPSFTQGTPLLFTAGLASHDYEKLVQEGGRVQLWSDFPRHDGGNNNGWGEMDFGDLATTSLGVKPLPLKSKFSFQNNPTKTLYLLISLPPSHLRAAHFSFTYRVAYTSGHIVWLGAFGQNGCITLHQSQSNILDDFFLCPGWNLDQAQNLHVYEVKEAVESLEVAKLNKISAFRIVALNPNSFNSQFKNASTFLLVPLIRQHALVILPTLVVAASHRMVLNLSEDGSLTVSGHGTIILQISDIHSDMNAVIGRLFSHSKLDNWKTLTSGPNTTTLVLAETRSNQTIYATMIPLWPSKYIPSSILLNLERLDILSSTREINELALFFPDENELHVLNRDDVKAQDILLESEPTNGDFIISPIHRLPTYPTTGRKIRGDWGVAILAPYNRISSSFKEDSMISSAIPVPPHLKTSTDKLTTDISPSCSASMNMTLSSTIPISEVSRTTKIDLITNDVDILQRTETDGDNVMIPSAALNERPQAARDVLLLFKSIFASVKAFVRFFFKIFLYPILPFEPMWFQRVFGFEQYKSEDPRIEDLDEPWTEEVVGASFLDNSHVGTPSNASEGSVRMVAETVPEDGPQDVSQEVDASDSTLFEDKMATSSGLTKEIITDPDFLGRPERSTSAEIFYAAVIRNEVSGRASFAIALLPPLTTDTDNLDTSGATESPPDLEGASERAIRFLDGPSPQCTVSTVDLFPSRLPTTERGHNICFLLEYEVDRENESEVRLISISSPAGSFV